MPIYFSTEEESPYRCFSNSSIGWFEIDEVYWQTVEHYYQAQKFSTPEYQEKIRKAESVEIAFQLGQSKQHAIRQDWELVKDAIMQKAVYAKFSTNLEIRGILLSTQNDNILFRSEDGYWGTGKDGRGQNKLGQILMQTRDALRLIANDPDAVQCGHSDKDSYRRVCIHILEKSSSGEDYYQYYPKESVYFDLICFECRQKIEAANIDLRKVCQRCFIDFIDGPPKGIIGEPKYKERDTQLAFQHHTITLKSRHPAGLVTIRPLSNSDGGDWIALTKHQELFQLDVINANWKKLADIPASQIDWEKPLSLHISPNSRFIAVANQRGQHGIVYDRFSGRISMQLDRKNYHEDSCNYSIAFFKKNNRTLLIHATNWNRLDVSDAETGQLLTERVPTPYKQGEPRPEHSLDYFHCGLLVSPDSQWVADNGWIWHPVGAVRAWNIDQWLEENVWESEDGPTLKTLLWRDYYWDGPMCWIDDRHLAVWGIGEDDYLLIPGIRIFNVVEGIELTTIFGPRGDLIFDQYLFAISKESGTSIWDVTTGERLHLDPAFHPDAYHPQNKEFITLMEEDRVQISRLSE